jgi:CRISPR-associated protein Cmr4
MDAPYAAPYEQFSKGDESDMFTKAKPFLLYAVSSVHAGSGSEVGLVDLPIQREQHTGFPKIESSSLKGAIRAACSHQARDDEEAKRRLRLIFGSDPNETEGDGSRELQAGAISLADARLLLFPVKSMRGVFAWVTCPYVLNRWNYELELFGNGSYEKFPVPDVNTVAPDSKLLIQLGGQKDKPTIVLGEYTLDVTPAEETSELGQALERLLSLHDMELEKRLVILDDDTFRDFVTLSTEVNARIRIESEKGTVVNKALWYEENLPPESVLYSFLFTGHVRIKNEDSTQNDGDSFRTDEDVLNYLMNDDNFPSVFQLGGNSTIGRGILRRIWL